MELDSVLQYRGHTSRWMCCEFWTRSIIYQFNLNFFCKIANLIVLLSQKITMIKVQPQHWSVVKGKLRTLWSMWHWKTIGSDSGQTVGVTARPGSSGRQASSPESSRLRREASAARAQEISMRFSCSWRCWSGLLVPSTGPSNTGTTFCRLEKER